MDSLFKKIPSELPEELSDTILNTDHVRVERIVSKGHASPDSFWYDQDRNELVVLVQGSAGLRFENKEEVVILKTGDYMVIDAHVKHRVEWTDPSCETIWLAVHY